MATKISTKAVANAINTVGENYGIDYIDITTPDFVSEFNSSLKELSTSEFIKLTSDVLIKCWKQIIKPYTTRRLYDFIDKSGDDMLGYIERFKVKAGKGKDFEKATNNNIEYTFSEIITQVSYDYIKKQFATSEYDDEYIDKFKSIEGMSNLFSAILTERLTNDCERYLNKLKGEFILSARPYSYDVVFTTNEEEGSQGYMNDLVYTMANTLTALKEPTDSSLFTPFYTQNEGVYNDDLVLLIAPHLEGGRALQLANTFNPDFIDLFKNAVVCYEFKDTEIEAMLIHKDTLNLFHVKDNSASDRVNTQEITTFARNITLSRFMDAFYPIVTFVKSNPNINLIEKLSDGAVSAGITLDVPTNTTQDKTLMRGKATDSMSIKVNVPSGKLKANVTVTGTNATYDSATSVITITALTPDTTGDVNYTLVIDYTE